MSFYLSKNIHKSGSASSNNLWLGIFFKLDVPRTVVKKNDVISFSLKLQCLEHGPKMWVHFPLPPGCAQASPTAMSTFIYFFFWCRGAAG